MAAADGVSAIGEGQGESGGVAACYTRGGQGGDQGMLHGVGSYALLHGEARLTGATWCGHDDTPPQTVRCSVVLLLFLMRTRRCGGGGARGSAAGPPCRHDRAAFGSRGASRWGLCEVPRVKWRHGQGR